MATKKPLLESPPTVVFIYFLLRGFVGVNANKSDNKNIFGDKIKLWLNKFKIN